MEAGTQPVRRIGTRSPGSRVKPLAWSPRPGTSWRPNPTADPQARREDRSMSGRHRKPTTSSVGVAKIAVTGFVLGGGSIVLAGQAQAATDAEWDTVANCEASGNWSINTGNGYHGGLQFAPAPGWATAAASTPPPPTWPPASSRSRSAKVLAGQGRAPGRSAAADFPGPRRAT